MPLRKAKGYSEAGKAKFWQAIAECDRLRSQLDNYGKVLTYDAQVSEPLKIYLKSDRVTGEELADLLYDRGIDGEFADEEGLVKFSMRIANMEVPCPRLPLPNPT